MTILIYFFLLVFIRPSKSKVTFVANIIIEIFVVMAYSAACALSWLDKIKETDNFHQRITIGKWISYGSMGIMYGSSVMVFIFLYFFNKNNFI